MRSGLVELADYSSSMVVLYYVPWGWLYLSYRVSAMVKEALAPGRRAMSVMASIDEPTATFVDSWKANITGQDKWLYGPRGSQWWTGEETR